MPRRKKDVRFDADAATIKRFFAQSWTAREEQKAASGMISGLNSEMQDAGVHPGVLSMMRRIAAMRDGQRGFFLFLVRRYSDVLEKELHDPAFEPPAESKAETEVRPFAQRSAAALGRSRILLPRAEKRLGLVLAEVRSRLASHPPAGA